MMTNEQLDALVKAAMETLRPTPHPLAPWLSPEELRSWLAKPDGYQQVVAAFNQREELVALAADDGDPLRYGFELKNWAEADALLARKKFLYVAGGKRAGKSEWAAKRFVEAALAYPRGKLWAFQGNSKTSIATQQALVWKYLPPQIKGLNGKQDRRRVFSVNFTPKNGFADGVLVLPNRTAIYFLTYEMEVRDYQGWKIGAEVAEGNEPPRAGSGNRAVQNIGFWADENMPLQWMETCEQRSTTNEAKGIWTFSTTEGITTTIKQVLGAAKTVKSLPAELLADRLNLPDIPRGHMPYVQEAQRSGWGAIYFFSEFNVFGSNYSGVRELCLGKPSHYVEENAYGYARDVMNKAFPLFGPWNVIAREGAKETKEANESNV